MHAAHLLPYVSILVLPASGWLYDSAFKDAATHPLRLFWVIPWFRVGAIASLDPVTKETLHSQICTLQAWPAYALCGLVARHILGALKHRFIDREAKLQRMRIRQRPAA